MCEMVFAVPPAKLPERSEPGGGVAGVGRWARGDEPSLHDVLQEAVLEEPLSRDALQLVRREDAGTIRLEAAELFERCGEFFVGCGHGRGPSATSLGCTRTIERCRTDTIERCRTD